MADWTNLKDSIKNTIKQNGNQEITGALLQSTLLSSVDIINNDKLDNTDLDIKSSSHVLSGSEFNYSGGPFNIIKFPNIYADVICNQVLYVSESIQNINAFFDNCVKYTIDLSNFSIINGYIGIGLHESLLYDKKTGKTIVHNISTVDPSEYVVLLHNEPNAVTGVLAANLNYSISDTSVSRMYELSNYDGSYYSKNITLYAGTAILLYGVCSSDDIAMEWYTKNSDGEWELSGTKYGIDGNNVKKYLFYNCETTKINIYSKSKENSYYVFLNIESRLRSKESLRNFMMNSLLFSPMKKIISIVSNADSSIDISIDTYENFNAFFPPCNERIRFNGFKEPTSFHIPQYRTLSYILDTNTIEVVNVPTDKRASIILAHCEDGLVTYGILADYLNTKLLLNKINSETKKWANKKMLCIGDSITDQAYWVNSLATLLGTVAYNRGLSGTTVADSSISNSFCARLDMEPNDSQTAKQYGFPNEADLVFVFGGINDWGRIRNQNLGTFNAAIDRSTFYGAWHYLLKGIKAKYPKATVCVLNLHHTYMYNSYVAWHEIEYNDPADETKGWSVCQNSVGNTLEDYRNAIEKVATFYGCHVIDLANCGMSFLNSTDRSNYTADGLHPNAAGGAVIANYIAAQLNAIN